MSFQRRQLLQLLPYAFGSGFILNRNELAMAAQPHSPHPGQRVLLRLRRRLLKTNLEEWKWKK